MVLFSKIIDKIKSFFSFIKKYIEIKINKDKIKEDGINLIKKKTGIDLKEDKKEIEPEETYTAPVSEVSNTPTTKYDKRHTIIEDIDCSLYKGIVSYGNDKAEKTLLIVDDLDFVYKLYQSDFNVIKREFNVDILQDFSIKFATGNKSGFIALNEINLDSNIEFALLDITLGSITKNTKGEYIELDGVDIALYLLNKNPKAKLLFISGHTLNRMNPKMNYYYKKFEEKTGLKIDDYYLYKNSDRFLPIYKKLYKDG